MKVVPQRQADGSLFAELDMALTKPELARGLRDAVGMDLLADGERYRATFDGLELTVVFEPLPSRRIALLEIPRLLVRLVMRESKPGAADAFLRRFEFHFRRGGG